MHLIKICTLLRSARTALNALKAASSTITQRVLSKEYDWFILYADFPPPPAVKSGLRLITSSPSVYVYIQPGIFLDSQTDRRYQTDGLPIRWGLLLLRKRINSPAIHRINKSSNCMHFNPFIHPPHGQLCHTFWYAQLICLIDLVSFSGLIISWLQKLGFCGV